MNGPCCQQFLFHFDFGNEILFLDTNELFDHVNVC